MTVLVGGAALLAAGAGVALILGWSTSDATMVWVSLCASAGAAIVLYLAARRSAGRAETGSREQEALARVVGTRLPTPAPLEPPAPQKLQESNEPVLEPAAEEPPAEQPPAKSSRGTVVAIPDRKRFHRPECRYAHAAGAEELTKTTARRRGYAPCGICKP